MDAATWDDRYRERDVMWGTAPNPFIVEAVGDLTPGSALDLACGEGRNSVWLAQQGWDVVGVDWSAVALDRAAGRAADAGVTVTWRREDLLQWTPGDETFDLVVIVYLQIPGPERRLVWERAASAVSAGGSLVVVGHDVRNLTDGVGGPQSPDVLYGPEEVVDVVSPDLEVVEIATLLRPVDGEDRDAVDNRVVAMRVET